MMPDLAAIFRKHLGEPKPPAGPDPPIVSEAVPAPATPKAPTPTPATPLPDPVQTEPRPTRPGALPGDPSAPVVDPEAARTLIVLELAQAGPYLAADGRLEITHPERITPQELAIVLRYATDIAALLAYRALMERLWPVSAEPLPFAPPSCRWNRTEEP